MWGHGVNAVWGAEMGPGAPAGTAATTTQLGPSLELHSDSLVSCVVDHRCITNHSTSQLSSAD